jgi:hypothetical protein
MTGTPWACASSASATASMTPTLCSMPIFTQSAPMSVSTRRICSATKAGGGACTPKTPSVFWAVSAVIAVMA